MDNQKVLSEKEVIEILTFQPKDFSFSVIREWCANTRSVPKYGMRSIMKIPKDFQKRISNEESENNWSVRSAPNWESISLTTVGRFIANSILFCRSKELRSTFDYINEPFDAKIIGKIENKLGESILEKTIVYDDYSFVVDRLQWLGMGITSFVTPSLTINTTTIPPKTKKLKDALLKTNEVALKGKDQKTLKLVTEIEKELLSSAKEELKDDPGMDIYNSGARGSFGNNYKKTAIMNGTLFNAADHTDMIVSTASLEDGIPVEEFDKYADQLVSASYGRSVKVGDAGYLVKQMNFAFQNLVLDEDPESDCKTTMYYNVKIDDPELYLYRFVKTNKGLVEITRKNLGEFKNKLVLLRSPLYCSLPNKICSRCAGTLYYRMGINNIGLLSSKVGSNLMNNSMKSFHDATVKLTEIDINKFYQKIDEKLI